MLSNLKIGRRLALGFCCILLFLAAVGGTGYRSLEKMASQIIFLSEKGDKLVEYAQRLRANINILRRYEKDLFLNIDDAGKMEGYKKQYDYHQTSAEFFPWWDTICPSRFGIVRSRITQQERLPCRKTKFSFRKV
jgi:hypothetical protein